MTRKKPAPHLMRGGNRFSARIMRKLSNGLDVFRLGPAMPVAIDVLLGVRDRGIRIGPGKADFERGERIAVDDQRLLVGAPDAGMPEAPPGFERLDVITLVEARHVWQPFVVLGSEGTTNPEKPV